MSGVRYHVHIGRSTSESNLVEARLIKTWMGRPFGARSREVGYTAFRVFPEDSEVVTMATALRELARAVEDELYRL